MTLLSHFETNDQLHHHLNTFIMTNYKRLSATKQKKSWKCYVQVALKFRRLWSNIFRFFLCGRAWPKAARRVPRRRLSTPSPVRIGTTSKHLQCSRCAMLAKRLSTELKEQSWHLMDSRPVSTKSLWPICKTNL